MNDEAPKRRRKRRKDSGTASVNTILVRFTVKALSPDHPDAPKGERKGRPSPLPLEPPPPS